MDDSYASLTLDMNETEPAESACEKTNNVLIKLTSMCPPPFDFFFVFLFFRHIKRRSVIYIVFIILSFWGLFPSCQSKKSVVNDLEFVHIKRQY